MAIKYISQSPKNKKWKISTTKTGKAIKAFNTQKEAIAYAATINSTEAIQIKRTSGWVLATSWDKKTIDTALKAESKAKAKGQNDVAAKKAAVKSVKTNLPKNTTTKKVTPKKVTPKKVTPKKVTPKKKPAIKKVITKKVTPKKKPVTKKVVAKKVTPKKKEIKKTITSKKVETKKIDSIKKVTPKKSATNKVSNEKKVAHKKTTTNKKIVKKPSTVKKVATKKTPANKNKNTKTNKPIIIEKTFDKNHLKNLKSKKDHQPLSGFLGFVLGLSIIAIFVSVAFILGYFL